MRQRLRPTGNCRPVWAALLIFVAFAGGLAAQDPPPASDAAGEDVPPTAAVLDDVIPGEVLPKIYLLKDKDGNLQPMPGMAFEDFMEAWKQRQQLAQPTRLPPFSIQKLTITGSVAGNRAELIAQLTVSVLSSGWVGVPLRLNDSFVRDPVIEGPGEHVLDYDPDRNGYIVWIRAEAGKNHQIRLKVLSTVTQVGPESSLRLNLPRAAVANLQLRVPAEHAEARVPEGCSLESARALEGGSTELNITGLGGQCDISWHPADASVAAVPTVLEATGALSVRVNGRAVHTEAKLTVRSLGGEFDRFQIRLPPGADYVGAPGSGMTLVALDASAARGKTYEVKLNKKTAGPAEVTLSTERVYNSSQSDQAIELGGFEVLGAVRQSGTVAIKVEGNWQLVLSDTNQATPIDDLDAVFRRSDLTAGFEYFAQPFTLAARIVPQPTRIRVQPEYVLLVGGAEAQLTSRLKYTIRGAKIRTLEVDMPGWEVDVVGPGNLVNVDAVSGGGNSPLSIPLLQASSGELELLVEAHRKLTPENAGLVFELPRPRGETIAPAMLAVLPADNLELTIHPELTQGLAAQSTRPPMTLPQRLQDPLYFRTEGERSSLACGIRIHEQSINASASTQIEVDEQKAQVTQHLAFQIAYEPTDRLTLGVPKSLRADRLTITLDGQRLVPELSRERVGEATDVVPLRLPLPEARIGRCELVVTYVVRHDRLADRANMRVSIPLVMPGEGQLTANDLLISPQSGISVSFPTDSDWSQEPRSDTTSDPGPLVLSARRALGTVVLVLSSRKQPVENAPIIERAWVRSKLTDSRRQDRAVFRIRSGEPRLQVILPAGVVSSTVEFQLDGRRATIEAIAAREVTVSLGTTLRGEHILEMSYPFAERPPTGSLTLEAPQIKGATWVQETYWQLLTPPGEHLLLAPARYTREFRWQWTVPLWTREPTSDDNALSLWCGLPDESSKLSAGNPEPVAGDPPAATTANVYLFSAMGSLDPLVVHTSSRARLVLWASLPILLMGLSLIYFPKLRHPAVAFVLVLLVLAASLIDSEAALLLAQASVLGLLLIGVGMLLARRSLQPVVLPTTPVRGSSQALIERGTTEIYHRLPSGSAPPSTATDPLMSTSLPESET